MTDVPTVQQIGLPATTRIIHAWNALSWLHRALAGLVILRILIALLIMLNILSLPSEMRFGWHLYHGGDQDIIFRLANSIIEGEPSREVVGIGQALVMIPFILLLRPYYYTDMVMPLVLINGFLFAGLSVWLLGILVKHTTGSDRTAVWSAALWSTLPLLAYIALFWNPTLRGVLVPVLGWLNGLTDGPATFFVLLAAMLLAQSRTAKPSFRRMLVIGMVLCAAILFRVHVAFMVIVMFACILIQHRWRGLAPAILGFLIAYIPQGWYNWVKFKLIFTTGYLSYYRFNKETGLVRPLSELLPTLPFSPHNIMQLFNQLFGDRLWLLIPVILAVAAMIAVCIMLWKRQGWQSVCLLIVLPMSYLLPMSLAWPFREDPIRFSIPAMPFLIAASIYAVQLIIQTSKLKTVFRET